MLKRLFALVIAVLIVNLAVVSSGNAQSKDLSPEEARAQVAKLGTGPKAVVRVTLRDGKKIQGWLSGVADDHFTVTGEKSGSITSIAYADVKEVKSLKPSRGMLAAGIVGGLALVVVIFLFVGAKH
ncbi:MAG TPA: hypothetical protein VJ875_04435 [Pyrinomonadaceae bacterium]|nr:hypothetical protein [Pyrinomonadaceae bacterium]